MAFFSNEESFDWILRNQNFLLHFLQRIKETPISPSVKNIQIGENAWKNKELVDFVLRCISLFPENSLKRGHCLQLDFLPTIWFAKGATLENITTTNILDEAETKYSLPCGHATWMEFKGDKTNVYRQRIELFEFPEYVLEFVVFVYLAYTVIHEYAHTLQKAAFYSKKYAANFLPGVQQKPYALLVQGQQIDAMSFQSEFVIDALKYSPITTYSAVYKDSDSDDLLHEYMADYIATYIMSFAMNVSTSTPENGFDDRPELLAKVKIFLDSEVVIL